MTPGKANIFQVITSLFLFVVMINFTVFSASATNTSMLNSDERTSIQELQEQYITIFEQFTLVTPVTKYTYRADSDDLTLHPPADITTPPPERV